MNSHEQFTEGARAYAAGEGQKRNPYEPQSLDWDNWIRGWRFTRDVETAAGVLGIEVPARTKPTEDK